MASFLLSLLVRFPPPPTPRPARQSSGFAALRVEIPDGSSGSPAHILRDYPPGRYPPPDYSPEPPAGLAAFADAASPTAALLAGEATVPAEILGRVPPPLLALLFRELQPGEAVAGGSPGRFQPGSAQVAGSAQSGNGHQQSTPEQGQEVVMDTRLALLQLLIERCSHDGVALQQAGGEGLFVGLLRDRDVRVRYRAALFLQQRLISTRAQQYGKAVRPLVQQAQLMNDEKLLGNPFLQISTMLEMRLIEF